MDTRNCPAICPTDVFDAAADPGAHARATSYRIDLPGGAIWAGRRPLLRPMMIRCRRGTVWVTVEGQPEDDVLTPGDSRIVIRRGLVVVQSIEDARIELL